MDEWARGTAESVVEEVLAVFGEVTALGIAAVLIEWQRDDGVSDREVIQTGVNTVLVASELGVLTRQDEQEMCDDCGRLCGPGSERDPDGEIFCQYCVDDYREYELMAAVASGDCEERVEDFDRERALEESSLEQETTP